MSSYNYEEEPQGVESFFSLKKDIRMKRFLISIKNIFSPKILEVGMGQGVFLKKISKLRPDTKIYGIDISKTAIEIVKKDNVLKGEFMVGDVQKIPFPDNIFDVVVMMDVLEHLSDPQKAIFEIRRVLKPKGIFHLYVPCENQPFTLVWFLRKTNFLDLGDFTKIHFGHIQYFSHKDIKKMINPFFSKVSTTFSAHLISQLFHLLTLYIPKKIITFFGKNIQKKTRDSYHAGNKKGINMSLLNILKIFWSLIILPVSLIYKIEANALKNCDFMAQGLHFTGQNNKKMD